MLQLVDLSYYPSGKNHLKIVHGIILEINVLEQSTVDQIKFCFRHFGLFFLITVRFYLPHNGDFLVYYRYKYII